MTQPPALTTTFTPGAQCLTYLYATNVPNVVVNLGNPTDHTSCFPSGWATDISSYFSPGICPFGYTSACSTLNALPDATTGETTAICCPSFYTCGTYTDRPCTSDFPGGLTYVLDVWNSGTKLGTSFTTSIGGANAFAVQIRFRATPTPISSSINPKTTATVTGVDLPVSSTSNAHSHGLSSGAKAGIGVGVTIGLLASLFILGALLLRRRRRRPEKQNPTVDRSPGIDTMPYGIFTKQELDGTSRENGAMNHASTHRAELDGTEFPGNMVHLEPGTRTRPLPVSSDLTTRSVEAETQIQVQPGSTETAATITPRTQPEDTNEPRSNADDAVPEKVSPSHGSRPEDVGGEEDIKQQLQRIRDEKERLSRINELERMELALEERLARRTT